MEKAAFIILAVKIVLAFLSFSLAAFLVFLGIELIRGEAGRARKVLSKFKFLGINLSTPSAGLAVVVVSLAWGLIGVRVLPGFEYKDGPFKFALSNPVSPIAETLFAMKGISGQQGPDAAKVAAEFDRLAKGRYPKTMSENVKTRVESSGGRTVFRLEASAGPKSVEELFVAKPRDGTVEFIPFRISAETKQIPNMEMKFNCSSSIEAYFRKIQGNPQAQDREAHRKALGSMCQREIEALPAGKRKEFDY